jgi:hypothetical protein
LIPINEINANNDELQAFILGLCNMWQIVNMPPALPSPVLQAKELAKRGSNNYVEMKRLLYLSLTFFYINFSELLHNTFLVLLENEKSTLINSTNVFHTEIVFFLKLVSTLD